MIRSLPELLALALIFLSKAVAISSAGEESTYHVGPDAPFVAIGDVPWESLRPGDTVLIDWRPEPYREKWVIARSGTADAPITVRGVPGPDGQLPVIDGDQAVTRRELDFWNQDRGVLKIGGSNIPADTAPAHILVENLEIRNGRPPFTFTDSNGAKQTYRPMAAAIHVEAGSFITIRNCILIQSGHGILSSHQASDLLIEHCHIADNGTEGGQYEHNAYTMSRRVTFQFNWFGPPREGSRGVNLKDRSAGTVIRYNRIEGGGRQLDLVDSPHASLRDAPEYQSTFVYGNLLIASGQPFYHVVHFGGDSGQLERYRSGVLYFYHNTVLSRQRGTTLLFRLTSPNGLVDAFNNIIHIAGDPRHSRLALTTGPGSLLFGHSTVFENWTPRHGAGNGFHRSGPIRPIPDPRFASPADDDFRLRPDSFALPAAKPLPPPLAVTHPVEYEYIHPQQSTRRLDCPLAPGAFGIDRQRP